MSNRGWKALDGVGISDSVHEIAIPMDKRAIHLVDKLNFQNYGQEGESIYSISRGALNKRMIDLGTGWSRIFFEQKIWDVTLSEATLHRRNGRGAWEEKYEIVLVLMVLSRIRHRMQRQSMFNYSQEFLNIGYKELNIPANQMVPIN
jgi:kynurenine 3-monooxygenase